MHEESKGQRCRWGKVLGSDNSFSFCVKRGVQVSWSNNESGAPNIACVTWQSLTFGTPSKGVNLLQRHWHVAFVQIECASIVIFGTLAPCNTRDSDWSKNAYGINLAYERMTCFVRYFIAILVECTTNRSICGWFANIDELLNAVN